MALRIFLCDDAGEVRAYLRDELEDLDGMEVVGEAAGAADALAAVAELRPDVIVLDLGMPEMDGLEALTRLSGTAPDTRVVVYSGFASRRLAGHARRLGASAYVEKGAPMAAVEQAIRAAGAGR